MKTYVPGLRNHRSLGSGRPPWSPETTSKGWGRPTFWSGSWGPRGRPDPENRRFLGPGEIGLDDYSLIRLCLIRFSFYNLKGRAMGSNFLGSPSCRPRVPPARWGVGGGGGGGWAGFAGGFAGGGSLVRVALGLYLYEVGVIPAPKCLGPGA